MTAWLVAGVILAIVLALVGLCVVLFARLGFRWWMVLILVLALAIFFFSFFSKAEDTDDIPETRALTVEMRRA